MDYVIVGCRIIYFFSDYCSKEILKTPLKNMNHFIVLNKLAALEAMENTLLSSVQTENLTVAYTDMKAGVETPLHHHPEEAVDILLEGELEMQIDEKKDILNRGMVSIIPSAVPHSAKAITDCKVVTIFYPQRKL
jgi:quercetin dioxygenase-like cupin family protein